MQELSSEIGRRREVVKIVGVGCTGVKSLEYIILRGISEVEFIAIDSDSVCLENSSADRKIFLGRDFTEGVPVFGRYAALKCGGEIKAALQHADMVLLIASMRDETEASASPAIASIAMETGALVVSFAVTFFENEMDSCPDTMNGRISLLKENSDALMVLPNDGLAECSYKINTTSITKGFFYRAISGAKNAMAVFARSITKECRCDQKDMFELLYDALYCDIRALVDVLLKSALVLIDFDDIRSTLGSAGTFTIGVGEGHGENRALDAIRKASNRPLAQVCMNGATKALLQVTSGGDTGISEVQQALCWIDGIIDPDAAFIWGHAFDPEMSNSMKVIVIASGMDKPIESLVL
jgi:cell division protein FtsZ